MLAFRLRPPLRFLLSRAYSSSSFFKKPALARPYLWWIKARYRKDGTRRSIILGILHGACYVGVTVYVYRHHQAIKDQKLLIQKLSHIVKLQHINWKYRNSTFTEPAEIKAYINDIAKVELIPGMSQTLSLFCEQYEALSENVPENRERIRERICELSEALSMTPNFLKSLAWKQDSFLLEIATGVQKPCEELLSVLVETLSVHLEKRPENLQEAVYQPARK